MKLVPEESKCIDWFISHIDNLKYLMTLFVGEAVFVKRLQALTKTVSTNDTLKRVNIYFSCSKMRRKEFIRTESMPAPYMSIKDNLSNILNLWFTLCKKNVAANNLYFTTFYKPDLIADFQFLAIMQAIEGFYEVNRKESKYLNDEDWKSESEKIVNNLPDSLNCDHKESLKRLLKYGNIYSLRKKMKELIKSLSLFVKNALTPYKDYYTKDIIDIRNNLTHPKQVNNMLEGDDLVKGLLRLKTLMLILMLKEIGINEEEVLTRIQKNDSFRLVFEVLENEREGSVSNVGVN